jgi:hypothetical protein
VAILKPPSKREPAPASAVAPAPRIATTTETPIAEPAPPPKPRAMTIAVAVEPPEAELFLDDQRLGKGTITHDLIPDGRAHTLRVTAPGFEPRTITFTDTPPPARLVLERQAKRPPARAARAAAVPAPSTPVPAPPAPAAKVGANRAPIIKE